MDSGYKAEDNQLIIDFFSKDNDPDANRFDITFANSVWTLRRALPPPKLGT